MIANHKHIGHNFADNPDKKLLLSCINTLFIPILKPKGFLILKERIQSSP